MPSYTFEIAAEHGTERHPFTLDDDRPLRQQVTQIIEELRQRGVMLRGGPTDVLAVYQGGRDLDVASAPATLGLLPGLPIELRMRQPERTISAQAHLPRGVAASALLGYAGAFVAWVIAGQVHDLGAVITSYTRLDLFAVALLGSLTGAALLGGAALRQRNSVTIGVASGVLLGGAGALTGASVVLLLAHPVTASALALARLGAWALAGCVAAAALALHALPLSWRRLAESGALGAIAGALAGALIGLPGPTPFWQAVGWLFFGTALGVAVVGPVLWRAPGLVELQHPRGLPAVLSLREWPVLDGAAVALSTAQVAAQEGRVAFYPPTSGATVNERGVAEPVYLDGFNLVAIGGASYEVRTRTQTG